MRSICSGQNQVQEPGIPLTFSFWQARAAALFSASTLRRPLAAKVMGQGQRSVSLQILVLVPTVRNCMYS